MQIMYKKICNIDLRDNFFGTRPIDDNKTLKRSRLSSEHAVLLRFLAHRLSPNSTSKREAANNTVKTVLSFQNKAAIPTTQKHKMVNAVKKLESKI